MSWLTKAKGISSLTGSSSQDENDIANMNKKIIILCINPSTNSDHPVVLVYRFELAEKADVILRK